MLIYLKTNFNNIHYYRLNYFNYYLKLFSLLKIFKIINCLHNVNSLTKTSLIFNYYNLFNIFFKNQIYIYNKFIKKSMFRLSFKPFITNLFISDLFIIDENYSFNKISTFLTKSIFLKIVIIKKLNYLKLKKFFKFLLYWLPLKIFNYYSILNYSFGIKSNFINEFHWLVLLFKNQKFFLKHHI